MSDTYPSENSITDREISEIIVRLDKLAWKNSWDELSKIYEVLDPKALTLVEMVAYLRSPFTYRTKFQGWAEFLERARPEIEARGRDSTKMLRGLIS